LKPAQSSRRPGDGDGFGKLSARQGAHALKLGRAQVRRKEFMRFAARDPPEGRC
jgi:hypothetical protein